MLAAIFMLLRQYFLVERPCFGAVITDEQPYAWVIHVILLLTNSEQIPTILSRVDYLCASGEEEVCNACMKKELSKDYHEVNYHDSWPRRGP